MASPSVLTTRVLLVCAAIGVATGLLGGIAGWITLPVLAGPAFLYGLVLGSHVLPGIIAQEVLRTPLVASAFNPAWSMRFIGTAILFGAIQEGVAALTRYRSWGAWRFFISAVIIGVIVAAVVFFAANLTVQPLWAQITYLVISVLGPVAWTAVGLAVGSALGRAGVARR